MFSEMSNHVWTFMAFEINDQCYSQIYGIVYSNDLIFFTNVHFGMANNVAKGSFHFLCTKKPFFIFWVWKVGLFCEEHTKYLLQNGTTLFLNNIRPYFMYNWLDGCMRNDSHKPLIKMTNYHRFSTNKVKFELQVLYSLLFIFSKNHF